MGTDERVRFTKQQKQILIGVVVAYTAAYLNRLNLSAALGSVMRAFNVSAAGAGLLQSVFAATYAVGQFVNGAVVDRVRPVRHILFGLAGTALCNLLMGVAPGYGFFLALSVLNGVFQSMLWTPIVRLLALCFTGQRARGKANFLLSFTIVGGHLGAWAISGFMVERVGWQMSFVVPALLTLPLIALVLSLLKPVRDVGAVQKKEEKGHPAALGAAPHVFAASGFFLILFACVLYGFVRDGIVTWAPEILRQSMTGSALSSTAFSLIIPAVNILGILIGYALTRKQEHSTRRFIGLMFLVSAVFCAALMGAKGALSIAMLMGAACACLYGLNMLLTGLVPLEYDKAGFTGMSAGLIDSFIYMGSALAGVIAGRVYGASGAATLYVIWSVSALIGGLSILLASAKRLLKTLAVSA